MDRDISIALMIAMSIRVFVDFAQFFAWVVRKYDERNK